MCGGISRNMLLVFVADNFRNEIFFFMLTVSSNFAYHICIDCVIEILS